MLVGGTPDRGPARAELFLAGIETVVDADGTVTQFTVPADGATLTTGRDAILPSEADQTVAATAATLNAGSLVYGTDGSVTLCRRTIASRVAPAATCCPSRAGAPSTSPGSTASPASRRCGSRSRPRPGCRTRSRCATGPDLTVTIDVEPGPTPTATSRSISPTVESRSGAGASRTPIAARAANQLQAGSVIDGGDGSDTLLLSAGWQSGGDVVYDPDRRHGAQTSESLSLIGLTSGNMAIAPSRDRRPGRVRGDQPRRQRQAGDGRRDPRRLSGKSITGTGGGPSRAPTPPARPSHT